MSLREQRKQREREKNARIAEILKKTGYVPTLDVFDPNRRQMDWILIKEFSDSDWILAEDRMLILDTGQPPYFPDARKRREGFSAKVKGDNIEIEYWNNGKKQTKCGITIALADWPMREDWRAGVPNLPLAHRDIVCVALTEMLQRIGAKADLVDLELKTAEICKAIYKALPDSMPEQSKQKKREGLKS